MSQLDKLYIAATGMITPVGFNTQMTAASVNAGVSAYAESDYISKSGKNIKVSQVPDDALLFDIEIEKDISFRPQYERIIKMALLALNETIETAQCKQRIKQAIPLIFALPENVPFVDQIPTNFLIENISKFSALPIDISRVHRIHTGRAAGLQSLELAYRYLYEQNEDFVLVGSSDSHLNLSLLNHLDERERLLYEGSVNGFCPGEGASFILLTRKIQYAQKQNNQVIALNTVGIADEPGYLESNEPYLGNGLSLAFKRALSNNSSHLISQVYSGMNGEPYWVKELGVAMTRSHQFFTNDYNVNHPVDCFGDLGAALGTAMVSLSALRLLSEEKENKHLVYCSSDGAKRSAVIVEKINVN
ncbi:MAG: 3-oxoacyl-[acyl-carrier-protein] synthase-1 [Psychromonas sp.]|uniref:hypothetical protein n=1 Tax=Psychromonas sp. TaxID=1884585 RepID=UPI0039E3C79F